MKSLVIPTETKKVFLSKSQAKKEIKDQMNIEYKKLDTVIKIYFETRSNEDLKNKVFQLKTHNNFIYLLDCFEQNDVNKFVSFLKQISKTEYFVASKYSMKNLTVSKFVDILFELCTLKNGTTKSINILNEDGTETPYIKAKFEIELIIDIFNLYQ